MAFTLEQVQTTGRELPPRMVLIGGHKVGKSEFASDSDNPFFLQIVEEEGIDALIGRNGMQASPVCCGYNDVMGWLGYLAKEKHDRKTVVIDSSSTLEPLIHAATVERWNATNTNKTKSIQMLGGGYGKGYEETLTEWRKILRALSWLREKRGMASIVICHAIAKAYSDPMYGDWDSWEADLNKKAASLLYRWSDCILFANMRVLASQDKDGNVASAQLASGEYQRCLYTQPSTCHPAGGRGKYGKLPAELPLNWKKFSEAVNKTGDPK